MESRIIHHDGKPYVRVNVHMLPTKGKSEIFKTDNKGLFGFNIKGAIPKDIEGGITPQQLYFTTDEIPSLNDFFMRNNEVYQVTAIGGYNKDLDKKIIATTNTYIQHRCVSLPQPPQNFIKAYCKQGGIDEVDVEYVFGYCKNQDANKKVYVPKICPTNNTMKIKQL